MRYIVRIGRRGYLARGRVVRRENATAYSSPSAARQAITNTQGRLGPCIIRPWRPA